MNVTTNINKEILLTARNVLSRTKMFTAAISERVTRELIAAITSKNSTRLEKKDVDVIENKLSINGNRQSIYTWLHHELFNRIIIRLRNAHVIRCPYIINTATKRHRELIYTFDDNTVDNLSLGERIRWYLINFEDCTNDTIVSAEIDMLCAYVASSILFSHIYYPVAYRALLSLTRADVNIKFGYMNLPIIDEPVFYRQFLSFHSASRLNRALRYYSSRSTDSAHFAGRDNEQPLFPLNFQLDSFPAQFGKWLSGVVKRTPGNNISSTPSLRRFIKGARCIAVLDSYSSSDGKSATIPAFIHSAHTRSISVYSYPDYFLSYLIKDFDKGTYTPALDMHHGIYTYKDKTLEDVIAKITTLRRRIYLDRTMKAKDKAREIDRIHAIVEEAKPSLTAHTYQNAVLYAEWFTARYHAGTDLKSLNDYASLVASFIDTLASAGKVATDITDDDLEATITDLKGHYRSRAIRSRTKDFMDFVTSEHGTNLSENIWRKKETAIQDVRTQKPFIGYDLIDETNYKALRFFATRQVRSGNGHAIRLKMASHSLTDWVEQRRHAFCLSFYTGLRRGEIISLRVRSIRFDDGPMLEIEEGKTKNAERTIPLHLLLPDSYLSDFMEFVDARRQQAGTDAFLFVREDGMLWAPKEFFEDIQDLFVSLGIPDYSFHDNRGSFSSWFLLRWIKVFHKDKLSGTEPFLKSELFDDKYDDRFRQLFMTTCFEAGDPLDFTNANFVLARLLGHGGPIITLERYTKTVDWIYMILLKHYESSNFTITAKQAAHLLQMPYSTLYRLLRSRNIEKILPDVLLQLQQELLLDKD